MNRSLSFAVVACAALLAAGGACATPYVPADDAAVLERLPEQADSSLRELKRWRRALAAAPTRLELALPFARRALDAARASGDPRYLGMAQAALAPWWRDADPPAPVLLLRATLRQSQHEFDAALADLDRLLERQPGDAQARLTRATVRAVVGRADDARSDCAALEGRASALVVAACRAGAAAADESTTGAPARGVDAELGAALAASRDPAGVRAWATTLAAERAARRGDAVAAERHFVAARALDPDDAYLRGTFADFLLDAGRPRDALAVVAGAERNDALLLRIALAERALPEARADFLRHRTALADRFAAARARGDVVHRREEARFRLDIEGDAAGALALARANAAVQREPADLALLARAEAAVRAGANGARASARDVSAARDGSPR